MSASAMTKRPRIAELLAFRAGPLVAATFLVPGLARPELRVLLAGFILWMLAESAVEHETEQERARSSSDDRGTRYMMLGAHLFAWWAPFVELALSPVPPAGWRLGLACLLLAVGGGLRLVAVITLGRRFTAHVLVSEGQEVCRIGLYRFIRHPAYVGLLLLNLAPSVGAGAWITLGPAIAATLAANALRVRVEEAALVSKLGPAYESYCREVPRWMPRFDRKPLPMAIDDDHGSST